VRLKNDKGETKAQATWRQKEGNKVLIARHLRADAR